MNVSINKNKVRELMAKKELGTFKELSKALGITPTQMSNILSNNYSPIKSNIVELAEFLGVSPIELLNDKKDKDNA